MCAVPGGVEIKVDLTKLDIDDIDQYRVSMLLMGYCLENIFKGIIVVGTWLDCPRCLEVDDFNKLYVPMNGCGPCMHIDSHELRNLLQTKAMKKITLSSEQKKMMDTLIKYIKWAGRYPMPKTQDEIDSMRWAAIEPIKSPYPILDSIYDRSMNELIRVCKLQGEK